MNKLKAIYFVDNTNNCDYDIKRVCKENNVSIELEIDFEKLISKVLSYRPDILIFNLKDYMSNIKYYQIFKTESPFYVPLIFIIGSIEPDFNLKLPTNYYYIKDTEFYDCLSKFIEKINKNKEKERAYLLISNFYFDQIYQEMIELGFNSSTNGSQYIKICINEIMLDKCRPNSMCNTLYEKVADSYNKSVASLTRCMKVAIDTAWNKKRKIPNINSKFCLTFNDFTECPSVKEFIYYAANKLYNHNQNNDFIKSLQLTLDENF